MLIFKNLILIHNVIISNVTPLIVRELRFDLSCTLDYVKLMLLEPN